MPVKVNLVRPDDLLNLSIEGVNLKLDTSDANAPKLAPENVDQPSYFIVSFPPQSVNETAFFEAAIVQPPVADPGDPSKSKVITPENDPNRPDIETDPSNSAHKTTGEPLPLPGSVNARLSHHSRLVFKVPDGVTIPFTLDGLLDWSKLELNVNPIAAIGANPTKDQISKAPAITEPSAIETAIELPFKLVISPNGEVSWQHRKLPFTSRGRTELWHTRLALKEDDNIIELSSKDPASLRAIWSSDYNPYQIPQPDKQEPGLGRTAMSPNDRHQIVVLTSAFHGYEVEIEINFPIFDLPKVSALDDVVLARPTSSRIIHFKETVSYVPKPFNAEQLMLTPLGGWLYSRGTWSPPRTEKPFIYTRPDIFKLFKPVDMHLSQRFREKPALRREHFDLPNVIINKPQPEQYQLDLSEWVHKATLGRDHYVKIVYEGELWPFRHRAALIKVTERKFKQKNGVVAAYLIQRMYIVVREPVKTFADTNRGNPFKQVRLTTLVTPDIADPSIISGTNRSFWVEVMTSATTRDLFRFNGVGTDIEGNDIDFTIPLMFVSISDVADSNNLQLVAGEYNASGNIVRRDLIIPGQKVFFAEPDTDPSKKNDNTQLVTQTMNFIVDKAGNPPRMLKADVLVPQIQELTGNNNPTTIGYFKDYVNGGFDPETGVFAEIVNLDSSKYTPDDPLAGMIAKTFGVTFSSDQAGGFATPNLGVSTLTRSLGPLAGKAADAVQNEFNPDEFFPKTVTDIAQIFGSFSLADLLPKSQNGNKSTIDKNAPKLKTRTEDIPGGKLLIATLDWEPDVQNIDLIIAAFEKDHNGTTKLKIHGQVEKPIKLDSLGAPITDGVKFTFSGTLNDFQVSVLKSVFINFTEFSFTAETDKKTDVTVKLDPEKSLEFGGDLAFVEELRKAIPPDLFGDGPSLELLSNPLGIKAGFAFTLPPVAVGVFSLKDVTLGASMTLPFLDGKPVFDFNVSERQHPFLLAVAIFGGGGFFHLQVDTAGIKLLEAAFEFGATAALDIGVASGEVHIMAGIYFAMQRKENSTDLAAVLSGYLRMGGSLNVLGLIKVSVEFNLSFTYDSETDKAYGRATLTVHVEVLFFSASVELTVERSFGGKSGDPTFIELFTTTDTWNEYALAFA